MIEDLGTEPILHSGGDNKSCSEDAFVIFVTVSIRSLSKLFVKVSC